MRSPHQRSGTLRHVEGRILLDLPISEAWDLAHAFSGSDGFHQDMVKTIIEAEQWIADRYDL